MLKMDDVQETMNAIKQKKNPDTLEVKKYVRYLVNIEKFTTEQIMKNVSHWDADMVERALKDVERENAKPAPKRYYVSLKEPLEDSRFK